VRNITPRRHGALRHAKDFLVRHETECLARNYAAYYIDYVKSHRGVGTRSHKTGEGCVTSVTRD